MNRKKILCHVLRFQQASDRQEQFPTPIINDQGENYDNQFVVMECSDKVKFQARNRRLEQAAPPALVSKKSLEQAEGPFMFQYIQRLRSQEQWQQKENGQFRHKPCLFRCSFCCHPELPEAITSYWQTG